MDRRISDKAIWRVATIYEVPSFNVDYHIPDNFSGIRDPPSNN